MGKATRASQKLLSITKEKTQKRVAEELTKRLGREVHQGSVTGWANGKHMPSGDVMVACLALYGIKLPWWYAESQERRAG